jgi:undecaprenyl diphosphate synthase
VKGLLHLLAEYIDPVTPELDEEGVQLPFIGERGAPVPRSAVERMEWSEQLTAANSRIKFFVPFNYGGRAEIVRAAALADGSSEDEFRERLYAPDMHAKRSRRQSRNTASGCANGPGRLGNPPGPSRLRN